jgi:hypothetical protein
VGEGDGCHAGVAGSGWLGLGLGRRCDGEDDDDGLDGDEEEVREKLIIRTRPRLDRDGPRCGSDCLEGDTGSVSAWFGFGGQLTGREDKFLLSEKKGGRINGTTDHFRSKPASLFIFYLLCNNNY